MKAGPSLFMDFTLMKMTPQQDDCDVKTMRLIKYENWAKQLC